MRRSPGYHNQLAFVSQRKGGVVLKTALKVHFNQTRTDSVKRAALFAPESFSLEHVKTGCKIREL
jgi:hypothetical protein